MNFQSNIQSTGFSVTDLP